MKSLKDKLKKKLRTRLINNENPRRNRKYFGMMMFAITAVVFLLFIGRFFQIVVSGEVKNVNLTEKVQKIYNRDSVIKAKRGTIYDSIGNPLAEDSTTYSVFAVLSKSYVTGTGEALFVKDKDKNKVAEVLSEALSMSKEDVLKKLNPKNKETYQVEFGNAGKGLSLAIKKKIESAKLTGIYFESSASRLYPNGTFASHLIGLAQPKKDDEKVEKLVGVMGLEKTYNTELSGVNGSTAYQTDSYGYKLQNSKIKEKAAVNGDDIYLTLDSHIQNYLESILDEVQAQYQAKSIGVMLMHAKTGQIVAASQRPTFNASTKDGLSDMWRDTLVEDTFEPGSTMKVFTIAAAINEGVFNPNQYYNSGKVQVDSSGGAVYDYNRTGWGSITLRQGFAHSSNVAMVYVQRLIGDQKWLDYIKKFGFTVSTKSGFENEAKGSVAYTYDMDKAITSFGQGIAVSHFQMMQAFTAIANNGTMLKPQIIDHIVDGKTGKTTDYSKPIEVGKPITAETASQVLTYMQDVVYSAEGTGTTYKIPGYQIAAKTGTAQISNDQGTGYLTGGENYVFSVVGMAPAENPEYILYVTVRQPNTSAGTEVLTKIFNPIMQMALTSSVPTESSNTSDSIKMPNVTSKSVDAAQQQLQGLGLTTAVIGSGDTIVQQLPQENSVVLSNQKVVLLTNGAMIMPDVTGWSKNDLMKLSEITGIKVSTSGDGYATAQSIEKQKSLVGVKKIKVTLTQPD